MPLYKFQVCDSEGKTRELCIDGDSAENAVAKIRRQGFLPIQCFGEAPGFQNGSWFRRDFNAFKFTNRLVPLLQAHVPLERALGIIAEGSSLDREREIVMSLRKGLHEGKKFSALIREQGNRFPRVYANLVEAGEEGGCLEDVMVNIQEFLTESKEQKDFLITSSIYPMVILSVTLLVLALVFGVFIPRFAQIFIDMGKALPLPTQILLTFSRGVNMLWPLWLLLILLLVWLVIRIKRGGRAREWYDRRVLRIPLIGKLVVTAEIARFTGTLAILLGNSVHLLRSVQISLNVLQNRIIAGSFDRVVPELRAGTKLSDALSRSPFLQSESIQLLRVGEEAGEIAPMMHQISMELNKSVKTDIKRLLALFEPAVIILLALLILVVVIAVFLAIIEMNNI